MTEEKQAGTVNKYAIEIKNLNHRFGSAQVLTDINISLPKGKIYGLIGADSAGKTTLLRLIAGLMIPSEGDIVTLGLDTTTQRDKLTKQLAYMPQKFGLYEDLTVQENLELFAGIKELPRADWEALFTKYLSMVDMNQFRKRLAGKLSGGMKQKLGLACALLGSPELLILDEPSVGVDPLSRRELFKLVRGAATSGTTVLWSTAYLDEAFNFDEVIFLNKGEEIFQGSPYKLGKDLASFGEKIIELMGGYKKNTLQYSIREDLPKVEYPVEALDLVKKYGTFYAVKDNTFHIKKGEIFGLLGPNGAGKSTSFKMMCGLAKPTAGTARIMGADIIREPVRARSYLGYMAQKFSLYADLTVRQNLEFYAAIYGLEGELKEKRLSDVLDQFGLRVYEKTKTEMLPLGYKQCLSFAAAILHQPAVLFLDEPTSGVDPVSRNLFWQQIRTLAGEGVTVLITTHFMDEAEWCDRISLFYRGESVALGTPDELKASMHTDSMEEAFIGLIEATDAKFEAETTK